MCMLITSLLITVRITQFILILFSAMYIHLLLFHLNLVKQEI